MLEQPFIISTQPLTREVEDFPSGRKGTKHVSLLTYLSHWKLKGFGW